MKKPSRRRAGFTLTELLTAMLLLSLLTLGTVTGVNAAVHTHRRAQALAECGTLSSTLLQAMQDQLRYARAVTVTDNGAALTFTSRDFGADARLAAHDGHLAVNAGGQTYALISEAAYTGQTARVHFAADSADRALITITLTIENDLLPALADGAAHPDTVYALTLRCINQSAA